MLFGALVRDTLLRLAISPTALYTPVWSTSILDELERNLRTQVQLRPENVERLLARMRSHFPHAIVDPDAETVRKMPNQASDRHVLATAVVAEARTLVTNNVRDFRGARWVGVRVQTPDDFLCALFFLFGTPRSAWGRRQSGSARAAEPPYAATIDTGVQSLQARYPAACAASTVPKPTRWGSVMRRAWRQVG